MQFADKVMCILNIVYIYIYCIYIYIYIYVCNIIIYIYIHTYIDIELHYCDGSWLVGKFEILVNQLEVSGGNNQTGKMQLVPPNIARENHHFE